MSAQPVDVLAYHDALIAQHKALSADAYHVQELPKAEAARDAVAELIEADKEYDAATAHYDSPEGYTKDGNERLRAAKARRAAALARVQGGQP